MRPGAIKLHINELVLHGFEQADRAAGDAESLTRASRIARLDGGAFEMPTHAGPEVAGTRLARAVYDGLTG